MGDVMQMEMEVQDELPLELAAQLDTRLEDSPLVQRLLAAAGALEQAAERWNGREIELQASLDAASQRTAQLERLLAEAEAQLAASRQGARKTQPGGVPALVTKDGTAVEAGALDAALASLSPEQRIAVKSQMLRAGLIG